MSEQKKSPFNLATIGSMCILGGIVSGLVAPQPHDQSSALGQWAAQLLMIIVGIGLIIAYFVRNSPQATRRKNRAPAGHARKHDRKVH